MQKDQKSLVEDISRWLRVGTLSLTVLGPLINTLASQLRERTAVPRVARKSSLLADSQEQLAATGTALSQVMRDLKKHPFNQQLMQRGEDLTEELQERIHNFSQVVVERGGQLSHDLARHSSRASWELRKRGEQLSQKLNRRELEKRDDMPWMIAGFAIGLAAAGIAAYLFIRRRVQQQIEEDAIELSQYRQLSNHAGTSQKGNVSPHSSRQEPASLQPRAAASTAATVVSDPAAIVAGLANAPDGARIVGIVTTGHYYPVETLLEQLSLSQPAEALEVVYFVSKEEAEAQGFSAAE
jgi:hypothetical protein